MLLFPVEALVIRHETLANNRKQIEKGLSCRSPEERCKQEDPQGSVLGPGLNKKFFVNVAEERSSWYHSSMESSALCVMTVFDETNAISEMSTRAPISSLIAQSSLNSKELGS